jgi:transposase
MVSYSKISYHDNFLSGKKCVFCGSFKVCRTKHGYIKCNKCKRQKGSHLLRRELKIIRRFYQQQPAYRLASDLGVNYQTVTRIYQKLREAIYHVSELESGKLRGEIELDEAYFGGRRKGKRGHGTAGKSIVFGLLERNGRVYTKVVDSVSAHELMEHIIKHTKKGSVYFTDTFRSYRSLKRFGKHHTISHGKKFPKTKNHSNGIEGFWSFAKYVLYNYRGVSKYHFPMYLKEVEYRFNHRTDNLLKLFTHIYFWLRF